MARPLQSKFLALGLALILCGPAYWAGYHAALRLSRQETPEYKVWQESYHVDRRFYEAIAKHPPPRYRPLRTGWGHAGGGALAILIGGLTFGTLMRLGRQPMAKDNSAASGPP